MGLKGVAMTGPLGLGDGNFQGYRSLAETKSADAQRPQLNRVDEGRWPSIGTVLRLLALICLAIVLLGWLLTVLNA